MEPTVSREIQYCPTCIEQRAPGACAPKRCYCGHTVCPAYASFIHREHIQAVVPKRIEHRETEAERANRYKDDD